jgi:hypothetical protein
MSLRGQSDRLSEQAEQLIEQVRELDAAWLRGTHGGTGGTAEARACGARVPRRDVLGSPRCGVVAADGGGGGGGGLAAAGWCNAIQGSLMLELEAWRDAQPLLRMLLHPCMHTVQWQKVFATVPPPAGLVSRAKEQASAEEANEEAEDELARDSTPWPSAAHGVKRDKGKLKLLTRAVGDEEVRRKAADEMRRLRAPGNMCLRPLWDHGMTTFAETIERVFKHQIHAPEQAATLRSTGVQSSE